MEIQLINAAASGDIDGLREILHGGTCANVNYRQVNLISETYD